MSLVRFVLVAAWCVALPAAAHPFPNPMPVPLEAGMGIEATALSPDGRLFAISLIPGPWSVTPRGKFDTLSSLRLIDTSNGTVVRLLKRPLSHLHQLLFSPDGAFLVGRGQPIDATGTALQFWRVADGAALAMTAPRDIRTGDDGNRWVRIQLGAFSPDSRMVCVIETAGATQGGETSRVLVWDVTTARLLREIALPQRPESAGFTANCKSIVVGTVSLGDNGRVVSESRLQLFDIGSGAAGRELVHEGRDWLPSVISPSGDTVALVKSDLTNYPGLSPATRIVLRALSDTVARNDIKIEVFDAVARTFSSDGSRFAYGDETGVIHIVDVATGRQLRTLSDCHCGAVSWLGLAAGATEMASYEARTQQLLLWNLTHPLTPQRLLQRNVAWPGVIAGLTASTNSSQLLGLRSTTLPVVEGVNDPIRSRLEVLSVDSTTRAESSTPAAEDAWEELVSKVTIESGHILTARVLAPGGRLLAGWYWSTPPTPSVPIASRSTGQGGVVVWDVASRKQLYELPAGNRQQGQLAFSGDGTKLAVLGTGSGSTITIYDATVGSKLTELNYGSFGVDKISLSHDGRRLALVANQRTVHVYEVPAATLLQTLDLDPQSLVASLVFSHDGTRLATTGSRNSNSRSFDGGLILNGGIGFAMRTVRPGRDGGQIALWNLATGGLLWSLDLPGQSLSSASFVGTSPVLAVGVNDAHRQGPYTRLQLIDSESGLIVREIPDICAILHLAISPDGRAAATSDGRHMRLWDLNQDANPTPLSGGMIYSSDS